MLGLRSGDLLLPHKQLQQQQQQQQQTTMHFICQVTRKVYKNRINQRRSGKKLPRLAKKRVV